MLVALPASVILLVGGVFDYIKAAEPATAAYDQALLSTAVGLAPYLSESGFVLPAETEASLRSDGVDQVLFAIRDLAGKHIGGDAELPEQPVLSQRNGRSYDTVEHRGRSLRLLNARLPTPIGDMQFLVGETTVKRDSMREQLMLALLTSNALLFAALFGALIWSVKVALRPLERLRVELASRSRADMRPVSAPSAPSELMPMVGEINALLGRLDSAAQAQNKFVSNAAHQLRTPLAALKSQLGLAIEQPMQPPVKRIVSAAYDASTRMTRLTTQLLALARAEPNAAQHAFVEVDLAKLLSDAVDGWVHQSLRFEVDLGFELDSAPVKGNSTLLLEAANNLIDNAMHYAGAGAQITVSSGGNDQTSWLCVEDNGPGVAPAEHANVLERFYRMPGSPGIGSGLGLSIVREIAAVHRAELRLETLQPNPPYGLRVWLIFNASSPTDPAIS